MIRLLIALLLLSGAASAQSVQQSGVVTPGHVPTWTTTGVIQDGGTPGSPQITGGIGVANSNQRSICTQNSKTGAVSQLCLGSTPTGTFLTSSTLSGPPQPFTIQVNGANFPFPAALLPFPFLDARTFGVKADGVTSDDVALKAAIDACSVAGTALYLPAGKIRLTGAGSTTSTIQNCHVMGAVGSAGGSNANAPSMGTTFQIESTTVKPFTCGSGWAVSYVNFWYPNQTDGVTVYPPTISDDGATQCHHATMDHFTVVNAYEFVVETPNLSWEAFQFSDFNCYAVKTCFSLSKTGDSFNFINARFTPTPWFDICNSTVPCFAAISAAAHVNAIYRATAQVGPGVTINVGSTEAFAWRYGFKVETNGTIEGSIVDINWDSVGTIIDATASGASWGINNIVRGFTPQCAIQNLGGASDVSNCFQMGPVSSLVLDHFSGAASGDWFQGSGSGLFMTGGLIGGVGLGDTGVDHYLVNVSAGNATVHVRGIDAGYAQSGTHFRGIKTDNIDDLIVQNNSWAGFNGVVTGPYRPTTIISGNMSRGDQGVAVVLTGVGSARYSNNQWQSPPLATVSACGTGAAINGTLSGGVNVGTTAGFTCTITTPVIITLQTCQFGISIGTAFSTVQVSAGVWRLSTPSVDISGTQIVYRCGGDS
jgi:hypothetical protein